MQTRFFWKTSGLVAVMLATATLTTRADDKPATARKPLVLLTDAAKKKAAASASGFLVQSLAYSPDGNVLVARTAAHRRTLGVAVTPADPVLRANVPATKGKLGLVVTSVVRNSPAAKAKIHIGDILLTIAAANLATASDLTTAVQKAKSPAIVTLIRNAQPLTVSVHFPPAAKLRMNNMYEVILTYGSVSKYTIGVSTSHVDATLAAQLVLPPSTGLVITHVAKGTPAEKVGLQKHDVILSLNDEYVTSEAGLGKALDKAAGKPVKIEFLRAGRKQNCAVTLVKRGQADQYRLWALSSGKLIQTRFVWNREVLDHSGLMRTRAVVSYHRPGWSSQVDRLSKQVDELKKTLDELKRQLSVRKTKTKPAK